MDEKQQKVELPAAHTRSLPPSASLAAFFMLVGLGFVIYGAAFHTISVRLQEAEPAVTPQAEEAEPTVAPEAQEPEATPAPQAPAAEQSQAIREPALVREITRRAATATTPGTVELGEPLPACPT